MMIIAYVTSNYRIEFSRHESVYEVYITNRLNGKHGVLFHPGDIYPTEEIARVYITLCESEKLIYTQPRMERIPIQNFGVDEYQHDKPVG